MKMFPSYDDEEATADAKYKRKASMTQTDIAAGNHFSQRDREEKRQRRVRDREERQRYAYARGHTPTRARVLN